jgi:hypothetical protein
VKCCAKMRIMESVFGRVARIGVFFDNRSALAAPLFAWIFALSIGGRRERLDPLANPRAAPVHVGKVKNRSR